jgi:hypothetical protein
MLELAAVKGRAAHEDLDVASGIALMFLAYEQQAKEAPLPEHHLAEIAITLVDQLDATQ